MKQQAITRYFNREVKTECNKTNYIKEEIDIDWDEKDNFYENAFDSIQTESPKAPDAQRPSDWKTGKKTIIEKSGNTQVTTFDNIRTESPIATVLQASTKTVKKTSIKKTSNTKKCPKCKKPCTLKSFGIHARYCGKERDLQCAHCPYKTKYKKCIMEHVTRKHPEGDDSRSKYKSGILKYCQKCEKSFEAITVANCEMCFSKLLLQCPTCNKIFDRSYDAKYHWNTRCGVRGYYHCNSCDFKAVSRFTVVKHSKQKHPNPQSNEIIHWKSLFIESESQISSTFRCPKCAKLLEDTYNFKHHVRQCKVVENDDNMIATSSSINDPNRCSICGKKFEHIYLLNRHTTYCIKNRGVNRITNDGDDEIIEVVEDHPPVTLISADEISKGIKQKAVQYCEKCMEESEIEQMWMKNSLTKKLRCSKCETSLVFKCKKCSKEYHTQREIRLHLKDVCYPEDEFKCAKCNFKAAKAYAVRLHYKYMHEAIRSECKRCGKTFKNINGCEAHMKLCGVEPKFQCEHCPYKSKLKYKLRYHIFRMHLDGDGSALIRTTERRHKRTASHLEAHCSKCKKKQLLNRQKICKKCKTRLNYKCKTCKKTYHVDDESACEHVKAYLETIKFECDRCNRGMITKYGLLKHQSWCGAEFACRFCKFVSNRKGVTGNHENRKHPKRVSVAPRGSFKKLFSN